MSRMIFALGMLVMSVVAPPSPRYMGPAKWKGSANNKPIKRLVVHCTAGAEPGAPNAAENTISYSKRTTRPSSYHYIADAKKSLQYVYDSVVAYHAPPNGNSIGYELCCSLSNQGKGHWGDEYHQAMLRIAAADFARLCLAYDIPVRRLSRLQARAGLKGIMGHNDVRDAWGQTSHWDPGPWFPWKQFFALINAEIERLTLPVKEPPPSRGKKVDRAIRLLKKARRETGNKFKSRRITRALKDLWDIKPR